MATTLQATAEALILARQRLAERLITVCKLAGHGNTTGARLLLDDAASDLDDIQQLQDTLDGQE